VSKSFASAASSSFEVGGGYHHAVGMVWISRGGTFWYVGIGVKYIGVWKFIWHFGWIFSRMTT
jgi:hypothetical protein